MNAVIAAGIALCVVYAIAWVIGIRRMLREHAAKQHAAALARLADDGGNYYQEETP